MARGYFIAAMVLVMAVATSIASPLQRTASPLEARDIRVIEDFTVEKTDVNTIRVSFGLAGERFAADMERNMNLLRKDYQLVLWDENEQIISKTSKSIFDVDAYKGVGFENSTRQRLTLLNDDMDFPQVHFTNVPIRQ